METNPLFQKDILNEKFNDALFKLELFGKMIEDKELAFKHSDKYDFHYVDAICRITAIDNINNRDINDKLYKNWVEFTCELLYIPKEDILNRGGLKTYPLEYFRYKSLFSIDFVSKRIYLDFNSQLKDEYKYLNKKEKEKNIPIFKSLSDYYNSIKCSKLEKLYFLIKNNLFNRKKCLENLAKINEVRIKHNEERKTSIKCSKDRIEKLEELKIEWEDKVKVLSKYGYKIIYD